jgi:hypothetical protein
VGQEAARLDGEDEARRHGVPPCAERARLGEAVEGVVELDGRKPRRVEPKPLGLRQIRRVEEPAPVAVDVATGTCQEPAGSGGT